MNIFLKPVLRSLCVTLSLAAPMGLAVTVYPTQVEAKTVKKSTLPKPYVSRALKAVLMPVTKSVAKKFRLAKGAKGVMVVSVQPDGIAKMAGLKPGDVISSILGYKVRQPIDVDTIIAYYLTNGVTDYALVGARKNGRTYRAVTPITWDYYYLPIDVYSVYEWTSFSYSSYSYTEYYSYYSETIISSYEYSETLIEERISETSFVSSMETTVEESSVSYDEEIVEGSYVSGGTGEVWSGNEGVVAYSAADDPAEPAFADAPEDTAFVEDAPAESDSEDASGVDEVSSDGTVADGATTDEGYADETATDGEVTDEATTDEGYTDETATDGEATDGATTDEGYTDETATDGEVTDEATTDEGYTDETATDGEATDEATTDEGYTDEAPAEEPAIEEEAPAEEYCAGEIVDGSCTEAAVEEPAYEEPAYEEPAYEEPAVEEPAYEDTGGGDGGEEYIE